MKGLLLALALHGGADPGSLGIGMDVLPEAFAYAASRERWAPHLTLATCDSRRCRWDLGAGVAMTASLTAGTLSLDRVEAELASGATAASVSGSTYAKACLTIVALLAPEVSPDEQRAIARSIASAADGTAAVRHDMPDTGTSFYGTGKAGTHGTAARCGAASASADIGSTL